MKQIIKVIIIASLLVAALNITVQIGSAQPIIPKPNSLSGPSEEQQAALKEQGGSTTGGYAVTFVIPFLTRFFVAFTGTASLISFVYGGVLYVTSFGEEGQTEKAKKIMMYAAIGLSVAMLSYALVAIVLKIRIGS